MSVGSWRSTRFSRRKALRGASVAGLGLAGAALVGCGGDDDETSGSNPTASSGSATSGGAATSSGTASAGGAGSGAPVEGGTLLLAGRDDIEHMDLTLSSTISAAQSTGPVYSTLIRYDPERMPETRELIGDLAESWEIADDGLSFTFKLNGGVKWHDGEPFTSTDVAATLERAKEKHPLKALISGVDTIETPDDLTAVVRVSRPSHFLMALLATPASSIVPNHIISVNDETLKTQPVGTGPYRFKRWEPDVVVEIEKNPDYHVAGLPHLDGQRFPILADEAAEVNAIRTGALHITGWSSGFSPEQIEPAVNDVPGLQIMPSSSPSLRAFLFNTTVEPYNDVRVRRAFSYLFSQPLAVDFTGVGGTSGFIRGDGGLSPEELTKLIPGYDGITDDDVAEAKKLLSAAGFGDGFETDYVRREGQDADNFQSFHQSQLRAANITLKPRILQYGAELTSAHRELRYTFSHTALPTSILHPAQYTTKYRTDDVDNRTGFSNADFDALFEKLLGAVDDDEVAELGKQLETILCNEVPNIIEMGIGYNYLVRPEIKNYKSPSFLRDNMDLRQIWIDEG